MFRSAICMAEQNHYEILQVHPRASDEVVKAAYRVLMNKYHPNKSGDNGDAGKNNSLCVKINEAWEVLGDAEKRAGFDQALRQQQPGTLGNYKILEQIAEGGFGITYKAQHKLLGELACLKQNIQVSPDDTEIMVKEAKLLWQIHHYSLPTLRDFFRIEDGSCVFAMTYIEGPTIDKIVEKHGAMDPEHVCWITQRLLNALHYLHFHGIVHCDVKPNNIIIKPEEHNAVLVDYGFASLRPRHKTKPEGYTEAFAAPELMALKPPLPQTDLYSLAVTMIYALGGNPLTRQFPGAVSGPIKDYFRSLLAANPLQRHSWEEHDLVKELSEVRYKVFGRRESNKPLIV